MLTVSATSDILERRKPTIAKNIHCNALTHLPVSRKASLVWYPNHISV